MSLERKLAKGFVRSLSQMERSRARNAKARQREQVARIKRIEREDKAKERERLKAEKEFDKYKKQQYIAAQKEEVEFKNHALEHELDSLQSILAATLEVDDYFDLENLKKTEVSHPFEDEQLQTPLAAPDNPEMPQEPIYLQPKKPFTLFGRKKKYQAVIDKATSEYDALLSNWKSEVMDLNGKYKKACSDFTNAEQERLESLRAAQEKYFSELEQHNAEVDKFINYFAYGDKSAVEDYISIVMDNSQYPENFKLEYEFDFDPPLGELGLKVTIPTPEVLTTVKAYKYVQSRDEVTNTNVSRAEIKRRYLSVLNQICLRTVHEVFESDRKPIINSVSIIIGTVDSDPATGIERFITLAGLTSGREEFEKINLSSVEPAATIKHLKAVVSKNPYELVEVDVSGVRKSL